MQSTWITRYRLECYRHSYIDDEMVVVDKHCACFSKHCGNNQLLWDVSINGYLLIVEMNVGCLEMQYKETFC